MSKPAFLALMCTLLAACAERPSPVVATSSATGGSAQIEPGSDEWRLHGHDAFEQRYSPLTQINTGNVDQLGLAWSADLDTQRGLEATPLVVDGVIYTTGSWSRVFAIDARSGKLLWTHDPKVPRTSAVNGCCDVVNRGVAIAQGRVLFATFDGRLISLDARTGAVQWSVDTIVDRTRPYSITGAPRIAKDKVIIGNSGAEFGVRGYFGAYDIQTGRLAWRFFTVPRTPDGPFEHPELERAAKTWDPGTKDWNNKGGGTAWDSMVYDAELNLLYVGTGNAPWTGAVPDPGEGDKLYTASILALNPDTGRLVWHYQQTPGDRWDFTATQHMILADLEIAGVVRKVLMQAPKNGFFYVLDRATGELISAEKYAFVTWASHVDLKSGRPVLTERARYWSPQREVLMYPWVAGAHNWHPMSYSPKTGLVYIPAQQAWWLHSSKRLTHFDEQSPDFEAARGDLPLKPTKGYLRAWDPVQGKVAWEVESPTLSNGGTLATAGDLVFQGTADGNFSAYDARTGKLLKQIFTGTGIIAAPITYRLDGEQYVAVLAGFGGGTFFMLDEQNPARKYLNTGRLLVFHLGGGPVPLPPLKPPVTPPEQQRFSLSSSAEEIARGIDLYRSNCGRCHGMLTSKALLPDLRELPDAKQQIFEQIVLGGALEPLGMPSFKQQLNRADVRAIQAALISLRNPSSAAFQGDPGVAGMRPGR